jgi:excisionase family DNA binding protein
MERLLFTVEEVAEALALSRSTIYRLLHRGDLVATRIGSAIRIPETSVRRFVDERTRTARRDGWSVR